MAPALQDGDWLVALRMGRVVPHRLVVVEGPGRPGFELVKRVTGVPGDARGGIVLGRDEYWVTGDREAASTDSRSFGPVRRSAIRGRVVLRYRPLRRFGPTPTVGGGSC